MELWQLGGRGGTTWGSDALVKGGRPLTSLSPESTGQEAEKQDCQVGGAKQVAKPRFTAERL